MYKLYFWYPWSFGKWICKGVYSTKKELSIQIKNKRETTYKIVKDNEVIEYHEAAGYCWRYGMVRPKSIKMTILNRGFEL